MNRGWVDNVVEFRSRASSEVHIHNAPLDSTISLMAEMEKRALEKILSSVKLENSEIDCVIHELDDHLQLQKKFLVRVKINGNILEVEHTSNCLDTEETVRGEIFKKLSDAIARNLLSRADVKHY